MSDPIFVNRTRPGYLLWMSNDGDFSKVLAAGAELATPEDVAAANADPEVASLLGNAQRARDRAYAEIEKLERERDDLKEGNESYRKGAIVMLAMVREKLGADLHPWVSETVRLLCGRVLAAEEECRQL